MLRLRFERQRRQLSQRAIAQMARLHQPVLCLIESGRLKPTDAELERLAAALRVPADELLKDVTVSEVAS